MPAINSPQKSTSPSPILPITELEHAKAAALGTLVYLDSASPNNAIDKFIALIGLSRNLDSNALRWSGIALSSNLFHCRR